MFKHIKSILKLKSRFIKKVLFGLLLLLLVVFLFVLLPPFLYNELEYNFNQQYDRVFYYLDKSIEDVEQRKSAVPEDYSLEQVDEYIAFGELVEADIDNAKQGIKKAEPYIKWQNILLPLLNNYYQQYHRDKLVAIREHQQVVADWSSLKHTEHASSNILMLIAINQQIATDLKNYELWWEAMSKMPETIQRINIYREQLSSSDYIDKELDNYYQEVVKLFKFIRSQADKVNQSGDWDSFDAQALNDLVNNSSATSNRAMFDRLKTTMLEHSNAYEERRHNNLLAIDDNKKYFTDHQLAYDRLSIWLALFSEKFPRLPKMYPLK